MAQKRETKIKRLTTQDSLRLKQVNKIATETGILLRRIRKQKGYTGQFVSDALGIPHPAIIYDYESGRTLIPLDRLQSILSIYDYDVVEFISKIKSLQSKRRNSK